VEKYFAKDFANNNPGAILGTKVGFMHPESMGTITYDEVCEGDTGYIEVVFILFDESKVKYYELVKFFFTFHDPTELNK